MKEGESHIWFDWVCLALFQTEEIHQNNKNPNSTVGQLAGKERHIFTVSSDSFI